jgi:hypothetical protein
MDFFNGLMGSGMLLKTLSILVSSHDNLIIKWYYDKLIRLPIKIGTLAFSETVDLDILKKYKVNVLTEKAEETVERSYEITKSFIKKTYEVWDVETEKKRPGTYANINELNIRNISTKRVIS